MIKARWMVWVVFAVMVANSHAVDITSPALPGGTEMVPYSATLEATDGVPPYTWSVPPSLVAWGVNGSGQSAIPPGLDDVVSMAGGEHHSLALKSDGTVVGWGNNNYGQTSVPAGLSNGVAIAAGATHSLALRINGTVVVWGINDKGQTNVPTGLSNGVAVAGGRDHSLALRADGTVLAWGDNGLGQTNVPAGLSNVVAIAGGWYHSMALHSNGTVVAWGGNGNGQTNVPADLSNVVAISAGAGFGMALKSDGTVVTWGDLAVPVGLSNVTAIAAGSRFSAALKSDGTLMTWGDTIGGLLDVPAGLSNSVALAAGYYHALVLRSKSTALPEGLVCSSNGMVSGIPTLAGTNRVTFIVQDSLGATTNEELEIVIASNSNTRPVISSNTPAVVAINLPEGGGSQMFQLWANDPEGSNLTYSWTWDGVGVGSNASSYQHTTAGGGIGIHLLRCTVSDGFWSNHVFAEWAVTVEDLPLEIITSALPAGQEMVSYHQTLEATNGIAPYTWSAVTNTVPTGLTCSTNGIVSGLPTGAGGPWEVEFIVQDSIGTLTNKTLEIVIAPNPNTRPVIASNAPPSSALSLVEGGVSQMFQLWANDPEGSNLTYSWTWDSQAVGVNASSYLHTTGWEGAGLHTLRCDVSDGLWSNVVFVEWTVTVTDIPIEITTSYLTGSPPGVPYSAHLEATNGASPYTWAIKSGVVGWGYNGDGAIDIPDDLSDIVALAGGGYHSLALQSNGTVLAWGNGGNGQTNVPAGLTQVVAIDAGDAHSLALQADGTVIAWGSNGLGQTNVPAGLALVVALAAGGAHNLVLQSNGTVVAWGYGEDGQTNVPAGLTNVVAIAAGWSHSLALHSNGTVVAWGNNDNGQTNVPAGLTNVVAIAAGDSHSLALQSNGTVVAWGYGLDGQTNVPVGLSNVVAISAGWYHCLALQSDGTVVAWGYGEDGQTNVPSNLAPIGLISAGGGHNLALQTKTVDLPVGLSCSTNGILSGTPTNAGIHFLTFIVRDQLGARTNKTLILVVGPDRATNNVPTWWLAQHGFTNFNADALLDADHDGQLTWQEWVAGCDPTDFQSVFRMTGISRVSGQRMIIRWPSISNRVYHLRRATNLLEGVTAFKLLTGATNLPATPSENVYTDTVSGVGPYFYKIEVSE